MLPATNYLIIMSLLFMLACLLCDLEEKKMKERIAVCGVTTRWHYTSSLILPCMP